MATENEINQLFDQLGAALTATTRAAGKDGTIAAIGREAVKDVRGALHEVFFGRPEGPGEPGAPLNPTQGEVAADRRETDLGCTPSQLLGSPLARESDGPLPSPSQVLDGGEQRGWVDRVSDRGPQGGNEGSDQAGPARGRSLPDEQRGRDEGRGR